MKTITKELLKQRSEHNDGNLDTLQEISLHQFDIEKIECLDFYCKRLQILLLQNNLIGRIENVNKLKDLKYLNLALNNIRVIEGLEGCECLEKLDLTVNFVEDLLGLECLKDSIHFRELYLVGNPCTMVDGYREFVITTLPQLTMLDGREVGKSERILSAQRYQEIRGRLVVMRAEAAFASIELSEQSAPSLELQSLTPQDTIDDIRIEEKRKQFNTTATKHTPEARVTLAKEVHLLRNGPEVIATPKAPRTITTKNGRVLQKNEGKFEYRWLETPETLTLVVAVSKFMDTSLVDVNVQPEYIVVGVKGKVLQLLLECEVVTEGVVCERCKLNGELMVVMLKESSRGRDLKSIHAERKKVNTEMQRREFDESLEAQKKPAQLLREQLKQLNKPKINIIKEVERVVLTEKPDDSLYHGEEYSDVPPLC